MEIKIGNFVLYAGRPKNEPTRKSEESVDFIGRWFTGYKATVPKHNEENLRKFSKAAIPRRAINIIKDAIVKLPWRITNVSPTDTNEYTQEKAMFASVLHQPNLSHDWKTFLKMVLEDTLVGDCGCFEKAKGATRYFLYPVNGFSVEMVENFNGKPESYRFAQRQHPTMMYFTPLEMDYIMKNPMTHTKFGLSPLESAFNHIAALLDVQEYCHGVTSNAMPKFLINLGKNLQPDQLRQYRQYFEEEVAGSGTTPIIASDGADAFQVSAINDDGTFLQYQQWLVSIIAHSFGIPPEKLGKGVSNDRSTKEQQDSDILEYAVKPYGDILESAINRLLVQMELGDKIKFEFVYEPTLAEVQRKTDIVKAQVALDMITIDEARAAIGYPALNTEYSKCTISEMKAKLNEEYAVQTGGTFGTAKDNYSDKPEKKAGDTSE